MQVDIQKLNEENTSGFLSVALNDSQTVMLIEELKKHHDVEGILETKGVNLKLKYADQADVSLDTLFIFFICLLNVIRIYTNKRSQIYDELHPIC